jgi:hypothetical protein
MSMLCEHISKIKTTWRSSTPALVMRDVRRAAEDYAVVYLGASIFKITRLLLVAVSSVHFFACIFFKVTGWRLGSEGIKPSMQFIDTQHALDSLRAMARGVGTYRSKTLLQKALTTFLLSTNRGA